ncbi:hypothetical protein ACJMK2_009605 [Sinanodonta woodiana]|uniref:Metalloendopeptidase n=1 Tax=Sinanodonta woodiana TaxID=1069815 RepID=A0ABD3VCT5_SINWO
MNGGRPSFQSLENTNENQNDVHRMEDAIFLQEGDLTKRQDFLQDTGGKPGELERRKRTVNNITSQQWTKGIIPFKFDPAILAAYKTAAQYTMNLWSYWTGYRFYPWNTTIHADFRLGHNVTLVFASGASGCWSYVGRIISTGNQALYCCGVATCIHELGHTLGLYHEVNNLERDSMIRVNYNDIKSDAINNFQIVSPRASTYAFYDYTSMMHYGPMTFSLTGQQVLTFLDPDLEYLLELRADGELFYPAFEVQISLNLSGTTCLGFSQVCYNGGYLSVVGGVCTCRCPDKLNPNDGCQSIKPKDTSLQTMSWPNEPFAMLKPLEGCPPGFHSDGTVKRYKDYNGYNFLPKTSVPFYVAGEFVLNYVREEFCVRDTSVRGDPANLADWSQGMIGSFCIHKAGGVCPKGFREGYIQYDDYTVAGVTISSGRLPDGVFSEPNATKMEFCCRTDNNSFGSLRLPNAVPFILYPKDSRDCIDVEGMFSVLQSYFFFNTKDSSLDGTSGDVPFTRQPYSNIERYKELYFCYYYPFNQDCGGLLDVAEGTPLTITTPNYPDNYDNAKQCTWFIKGPENGKLRLQFETFNLTRNADGTCDDTVEIRHTFPGHRGMRVCGDGFLKTIITEANYLALVLTTDESNARKGFKAIIDVITEAQLAYVGEGSNGIYSGTVNITKNFDVCIPWEDAAGICDHHPFKAGDYDDQLDMNYCRNPGTGNRPWCYTNVDECIRDYCDVTYNENCYNYFSDCKDVIAEDPSFCTSSQASKCAVSCNICSKRIKPQLSPTITCGRPENVPDGKFEPVKSSYVIGEMVIYTCQDGKNTKQRYCSSEGTWVPNLNFVCEARVVCNDQDEDCTGVIERNPDVCITYPDFAWMKCPKSCGRCIYSDPPGSCANPGTPENAVLIRGNALINVGDYFQYKCNVGFSLNGGNLQRACQLSGQLTGSAPVCVDETKIPTPINDLSIRKRSNIDVGRYATFGNNSYFRITKRGEIRSWHFYSYISGQLGLQVWRPNGTSFSFVGQNIVANARDDRERYIEIAPQNRIQVEVNDLIGFTYFSSTSAGGIPYDWCNQVLAPNAVKILKSVAQFSAATQTVVGTSYAFTAFTTNTCRLYSLNAIVGPRA